MACLGGGRWLGHRVAVSYRCRIHSAAAVAVERYRVGIHRPFGVKRDAVFYRRTEIEGGCKFFVGVPVNKGVACFGGRSNLRCRFAFYQLLRGYGAAAVCVEGYRDDERAAINPSGVERSIGGYLIGAKIPDAAIGFVIIPPAKDVAAAGGVLRLTNCVAMSHLLRFDVAAAFAIEGYGVNIYGGESFDSSVHRTDSSGSIGSELIFCAGGQPRQQPGCGNVPSLGIYFCFAGGEVGRCRRICRNTPQVAFGGYFCTIGNRFVQRSGGGGYFRSITRSRFRYCLNELGVVRILLIIVVKVPGPIGCI